MLLSFFCPFFLISAAAHRAQQTENELQRKSKFNELIFIRRNLRYENAIKTFFRYGQNLMITRRRR